MEVIIVGKTSQDEDLIVKIIILHFLMNRIILNIENHSMRYLLALFSETVHKIIIQPV